MIYLPVVFISEDVELLGRCLDKVSQSLIYWQRAMPDFLHDCLGYNHIGDGFVGQHINLKI